MASITLTVLFESPFWVGIFEREVDGEYRVARTVFGGEPKDFEVYEFVINNEHELRYTSPLEVDVVKKKINPKRQQREVRKTMQEQGITSKAQEALRLEIEKNKKEKKGLRKERREELKQQQFDLRQRKKKEKKKGH